MHTISFGFTVSGALEEVKVFANGMPVHCFPLGNGKFTGGFNNAQIKDGSILEIQFHLYGTIGTAYGIEYKFLDNGNEEEDPGKPSPVSGSITTNNKKIEKVKFKA